MFQQILAIWLIVAGIAWMLRGWRGGARPVLVNAPRIIGNLLLDLLFGLSRLIGDVCDIWSRRIGRLLNRFIRWALRI